MARLNQLQDIDLKLLRYFCTIVEENSFTAAQAKLNISQSSLSEYLKSLEIRLGVTLCQRGPKGFSLFSEGRELYEAAQSLFQAIDTFKNKVSEIGNDITGELQVYIMDSIINNPSSKIPEGIKNFTLRFPKVQLRIELMRCDQLTARLSEGKISVGIGIPNERVDNLFKHHLFNENLELCCASGHKLFEADDTIITNDLIRSHAYCNRGHYEILRTEQSESLSDIGLGGDAQLALVLSGRDIGYLPQHVASPYKSIGQIRALNPNEFTRTIPVLIMANNAHYQNNLIKEFITEIGDSHSNAAIPKITEEKPSYSIA